MDTRLRDATGCPLADFDVLSQIADAGGRLRMTELADRVLVSRSGLTRRVASLEDEGLVERTPARDDGRGVLVSLTDAGFRRMVETQTAHSQDVKDLFIARLSDRELATIERVMRKVFVDCSFG
jgi:DNA-binding MarR family transcriptional regulator